MPRISALFTVAWLRRQALRMREGRSLRHAGQTTRQRALRTGLVKGPFPRVCPSLHWRPPCPLVQCQPTQPRYRLTFKNPWRCRQQLPCR